MKRVALVVMVLVACGGGGAGPADASAPDPDASASDATPDAPLAADANDASDAAPVDPCPTLPIPTTCFNRNVVYREWSMTATGDGTYFASQAPWRLGFTRSQNTMWTVKVKLEANTYWGRISAYGDSSSGVAWISDKPCDATFAEANKLTIYGNNGGGVLNFVVVRNAQDAVTIQTNSQYATYKTMPQLQGGACYYVSFENVSTYPTGGVADANFIATAGDDCGANSGGTCYYLAMDFNHLLHNPQTMQLFTSNVIAGLTQ